MNIWEGNRNSRILRMFSLNHHVRAWSGLFVVHRELLDGGRLLKVEQVRGRLQLELELVAEASAGRPLEPKSMDRKNPERRRVTGSRGDRVVQCAEKEERSGPIRWVTHGGGGESFHSA
jgi:hypothetical protein